MKKLLFAIAAVACIAFTSSCTQVVVAQYGYDGTSLQYVVGYEDEVTAFAAECQATNDSFNGTSFTEEQYINAFEVVVNKYDHKHIFGPFKIFKDQQSNVIKTFNMTQGPENTQQGVEAVQAKNMRSSAKTRQ